MINIYTDGSCDTSSLTGAWATIVHHGEQVTTLTGIEKNVTHQQMELLSVINGIRHLEDSDTMHGTITVYSDSQYVVDLVHRKIKLKQKQFLTKAGVAVRNSELVQQLIQYMDRYDLIFVKLKSHAMVTSSHQQKNRQVDMLARKELRRYLSGEV